MRLSRLLPGRALPADPEIAGLTEDSRRVTPGTVFVAVPGAAQDGHAYIREAIARGAAAVVAERPAEADVGIPVVLVPSARDALASMAARFHGSPGDSLAIVGFTGTFGKTSTSEVLRALLAAGGVRPGVVGSLGARYGGFHAPGPGLTTPAPVELHGFLRALQNAGADTVIMEVTSHALRMRRVHGLRFSGGLVAAIMPGEHTDFHGTFDDYVAAKRLFLEYLDSGGVLAFDADNAPARELAARAPTPRRHGFSFQGRPDALTIDDVVLDASGASFTAGGARMRSTLRGRGHMRNAALAVTYALAHGVTVDAARRVLAGLEPLPRRMEISGLAGRRVLDDTAAHPESLLAAFEVAAMLPRASLLVGYAVRGNRGPDINRRNAAALAALAADARADCLILTASADAVGQEDRPAAEEIDVTRQTLQQAGAPFTWHDTLRAAAADIAASSRPGDLILLLGAQGMNAGARLLRAAFVPT